jgi:hypothetical protein
MAEKQKAYNAKFPEEIIRQAHHTFCGCLEEDSVIKNSTWEISDGSETWGFDSEDDFYVQYSKTISRASLTYIDVPASADMRRFYVEYQGRGSLLGETTTVAVSLPSKSSIERVFAVFDDSYEKYRTKQQADDQLRTYPGKQKNDIELTGSQSVHHAIVVNPENLAHFDAFLKDNFQDVSYKAECIDGTKISVGTLQNLLEYANPGFRRLEKITVQGFELSEEDSLRQENFVHVILGGEAQFPSRTAQVYLSFTDVKRYNFVESEMLKLIKTMRPWYSPLTGIQFRYLFTLGLLLLGFTVFTVYYTGGLFRLWTVLSTTSSSSSSSSGIFEVVGIVALLYLAGYLIDRARDYLFPRFFFCLGEQAKVFERREKILDGVVLAFVISVAAGFVVYYLTK